MKARYIYKYLEEFPYDIKNGYDCGGNKLNIRDKSAKSS